MADMQQRSQWSRRRFVQQGAGAAAAGAVAMTGAHLSGSAAQRRGDVTVAATVVRASQSAAKPGTLRLGIRASVLTPDGVAEGSVLILDGLDFFASQEEINQRVTDLVRSEVQAYLERRGQTISPERIAVRVFGGVW